MDLQEKLKPVELEALRLTLHGKSEVQAYMVTHPKAGKKSAASNAYKFFKRAREKLSISDRLELYNLGVDRIFSTLDKMLNAEYDITYQGKKTGRAADNQTRMKALELLIKIHGLEIQAQQESETEQEDNVLRIIIDDDCQPQESK